MDFENMKRVEDIHVNEKSIRELVEEMGKTSFQGRALGKALKIWEKMKDDKVTIVMGLAGSMGTAGQYGIVNWLIEHGYVNVLVSTGANISEDIISAMGGEYLQGDPYVGDAELLETDYFRYYDTYCSATDYIKMEKIIEEHIEQFCRVQCSHDIMDYKAVSIPVSSSTFLRSFGLELWGKNIRSMIATAAARNVPVFCPAICDSGYGDAFLQAIQKGYRLQIDGMRDYEEIMEIGKKAKDTGVVYIGGGVPKDFTQLMAACLTFSLPEGQKGKLDRNGAQHESTGEWYYPHKYAIQITTDSQQWGGLSGCTLEEAISWGKTNKDRDNLVTVYCDATIALPILVQALAERERQ